MPYGMPGCTGPARKYLMPHEAGRYHSPLAALGPAESLLGGLGGRFKSRAAHEAERADYYDRQAEAAMGGSAAALEDLRQQGGVEVPGKKGPPWPHIAPSEGSKQYAAGLYAEVVKALPKAKTVLEGVEEGLSAVGKSPLAIALAKGLTTRRRRGYSSYGGGYGRRRRAPQYYDEEAGLVSPKSFQKAAGVGASGAGVVGGVGGASALATAGVAIAGLAAGYYIGYNLNKYLAGKALSAEEAGLAAAKAFRDARAQAAARKGSALTAAEVRSLGAQYKAQLVSLGYDPVTFTRTRSALESFFTGEEEE